MTGVIVKKYDTLVVRGYSVQTTKFIETSKLSTNIGLSGGTLVMWHKRLKFSVASFLVLLGLFIVFQFPVLALVSDTYTFSDPCLGPGGATTMGLVGPLNFGVAYVGSSTWIDTFVCDDMLGCLYMVRQPLSAGENIHSAVWSSVSAVNIWSGWCG